jgi:Tfp pilus assembly protein PilV
MCSVERRSTSKARRRRSRGISLLEALAAMGLLSAALLALAGSSITLTRAEKSADSTSSATALALQTLEHLRSMPLGAVQLTPGLYFDVSNPLRADGTTGGIYTRSWTVSPNDTPRLGLRLVTVTVEWTDSQPRATRLAAYVRCSKIPC